MSAQPGYPAVEIDPQPVASGGGGGSRSRSRSNPLGQLWGSRAGRFALAAGVALVILIVTLARRQEPEAPAAPEKDPLLAEGTDPFAGLGANIGATQVPPGGFDFGGQIITGGEDPGPAFTDEGEVLPAKPEVSPVTVIVNPATPQPVAPAPPNTSGAGATPGPGKPTAPAPRKRGFYRAQLGPVEFHDGKGGPAVSVALTEADRKAINTTWNSVKKTKKDQRFSLRGHSLTMNEQGSFAPV